MKNKSSTFQRGIRPPASLCEAGRARRKDFFKNPSSPQQVGATRNRVAGYSGKVLDKGFSLVELIVVLIILSLSISLVTPSLSRFSKGIELKGAVKKVSGILRHCRSEAVNKGKIYQVLIDSDVREMRVKSLEEMGEDTKKAEKQDKKIYPLSEGIQIKEVNIPASQYTSNLPIIEFYPNGGSNGGSILLSNEGRKGYKIKVHFLTGMVKVESAEGI